MHQTQTPSHTAGVLARLLEPVGHCLTPEVARALVNVHADAAVQARLEELAEKSSESTLTEEERAEYEAYVHALDFISVLQAQARRVLNFPSVC